jgi:aminodeoxyfutalosine deaminase
MVRMSDVPLPPPEPDRARGRLPGSLDDFIAGVPKAEIHVHHVGSASPRIVSELAARHPGKVPSDLDALREFYRFRDFAHFIEVYLAVVDLVREPDDVRLLTYEVAAEMAAQNVRYAEMTLTPYTSVMAGVPIEAFVEAVEDARTSAERDHGIRLRWVYDIPGEFGLPAAEATVEYAVDHARDTLIGFGLGGPEIGVERPQFEPVFARARAAGLHSVPHAGETTGPQTIWDALEHLGAERIGHGTSAVQDPRLVEHLVDKQVPLEVCPTSNIATRAVDTLENHPIRALYDAGVLVTVNSDDPPMFGTTLTREYQIAAELLDLDASGVAALATNAVRASFLPEHEKAALAGEISDYLAAWDGSAGT